MKKNESSKLAKLASFDNLKIQFFLVFTVTEQKRILQVGTCLTCHDEKSKVMERALDDWEKTLAGRSKKCVLAN